MLDVDGGDHRDPGVEQLLDILPSLGVLAARRVGVGKLVDQDHLRVTCQYGRHVDLGEAGATVFEVARRDDLDVLDHLRGSLAAVGLHHRGH